jgi:hypothetical protein
MRGAVIATNKEEPEFVVHSTMEQSEYERLHCTRMSYTSQFMDKDDECLLDTYSCCTESVMTYRSKPSIVIEQMYSSEYNS